MELIILFIKQLMENTSSKRLVQKLIKSILTIKGQDSFVFFILNENK